MYAFHFRAIDENLAIRTRIRQTFDKPRIKLERECHAWLAFSIRLIGIGTQRCFDQVAETTQNLVIIDAWNAEKCRFDTVDQLLFSSVATLGRWVEAQIKQRIKITGDFRIAVECCGNETLRIGNTCLLQIAAIRTQDHDLACAQTCGLHQSVITVIISESVPDIAEHIFQHLTIIGQINRRAIGVHELHVMHVNCSTIFACLRQIDGLLANNAEAHVFKKRHAL